MPLYVVGCVLLLLGYGDTIVLGYAVPALSSFNFAAAQAVLEQALATRTIPSAVAAVGTSHDVDIIFAQGVRRYTQENHDDDFMFIEDVSVSERTLYDMGALTQVMATLPGVLELLKDKYIHVQDRVGRFFSNAGYWQDRPLADVTLAELLTHTSGLPPWKAIYAITPHRKTAIANVLHTELTVDTGTWVLSDLNYMVLGAVLERVTRIRLDEFVGHYVFEPLGLFHTSYGPIVDVPVAATEYCGWRGEVLEGQVQDENAFVMDGIAGHAGIFSNIIDVATYAQAWLNSDLRLAPATLLQAATHPHICQDDICFGYGWELASKGNALGQHSQHGQHSQNGQHGRQHGQSNGQHTPPMAYGFSSFTGTSIWINPAQGWFCVLLTNAIHPHRANATRFHDTRTLFHNAVADAFNQFRE